jgi:transposase
MKYERLSPALNERTRRLWAATEALALGGGAKSLVARATGLAFNTVQRGVQELEEKNPLAFDRIRRPGGGRKKATELNPELGKALDRLVEPATRGDPEGPLRWTCKSTRRLAAELQGQGHRISHTLVATLLAEQGYSLQANRKTKEGASHPDRNAQFEHIDRKVHAQLRANQPAISVDTKKKELVGEFKNAGREWTGKGQPIPVKVHDFPDPRKGKAVPYGVYDLVHNAGWVSVGVDHDTASFAANTIRRWWQGMGRKRYAKAESLLIVADCGGSNGPRVRLWKWELQGLADRLGIPISVCHLPPGTSKWNKIEHRLFSFISQNWRGKPLLTHATIVHLIAGTTTTTGLTVRCVLDTRKYPNKTQVTDDQMASIDIKPDRFHGEWNYTIRPREP